MGSILFLKDFYFAILNICVAGW